MRGLRWWGSGREATQPPRLGDPARPRLGSEVGETEADGGWTTAWPRAPQGVSSRAPKGASLCSRSPASVTPPACLWLLSASSFHPRPTPGGQLGNDAPGAGAVGCVQGGRGEGPSLERKWRVGGDGGGARQVHAAPRLPRGQGASSPCLVTRGQKQVSSCYSAEPPASCLAPGLTCWFQAISEPVGIHIPLEALS